MANKTNARPSKRYESAAKDKRDRMTARLGTLFATMTGVISEGELGGVGLAKNRDRPTRSTNEGERIRARKMGRSTAAICKDIIAIAGEYDDGHEYGWKVEDHE